MFHKTLIAIVLTASVAFAAEPPPGDNVLGLYTAPSFEGEVGTCLEVEPSDFVYVYLVLSGATVSEIRCIEFGLTWTGDFSILTAILPIMGDTGMTPWDNKVIYYYGGMAVTDDVVLLATLWLWIEASAEEMFLGPALSASLPGQMAILTGPPYDLVPMQPASGSFDVPVFTFNDCVPLPAERTTWSTVKALFR